MAMAALRAIALVDLDQHHERLSRWAREGHSFEHSCNVYSEKMHRAERRAGV